MVKERAAVKILRDVMVVLIAALFVMSFASPTIAKEKMIVLKGSVVSVDAAGKTLTVKEKKGEVTIAWDQATKVTMGKEKKAFEDLKAGDKVLVRYHEKEGKAVANSIAITKAPAPMKEKASEKVHG